ncbi:MAG: hypothetical protein MK111_01355 [Crocosphaera sp.]|uniref:SPOR domain-containing protein n=3 Tax=Crocosphaera watsonii TaxID=263511 RepID=T2JZX3_CROWT|nr:MULTISPECIES: hypothetical protein [Crocosphaera]EHJ09538.1 hypothetical protein CWATWH0003_B037 [Crocosphaera watsonii WH 0003]MCH2243285.1 hypothetical protein [Crocosphaera sp.]NQZ63688.1 hypothetical protein [Crocosphaera sp.]CCQ56986.1 hypothetical protein CWATWH0005_3570 [Crocosphaera watsonii WH 0005]CCQ70840.1 hypothetical protein CWATWH0402_2470 [Crocosphaera watsonii WH 0402]
MNKVRQKLSLLTLLLLSGCNLLPFNSSSSKPSKDCASKPPTELVLKNVKDITLESNLEKIGEGRINSQETIGYKFQGKSGQKLQLELTEGVCIWIIDPSNEIFEETTLTENGTYLVQLSAQKGKLTNYILSMGLDIKTPSPTPTLPPISSSSMPTLSDFPKNRCGDDLPSNADAYPLNFYPVFVPLSKDNLENLRNNFCQDAFPVIRKDTQVKEIQVSSFSSLEKSQQFVQFLENQSIEAEVGQATVIESPR